MDMLQRRLIDITLEERATDADKLGDLKARIADLNDVVDDVKARLIDTASKPEFGTRTFEGKKFRAVVSFENKTNTNWKAVITDLIDNGNAILKAEISALIIKHTQIAEGVPSVRTYARKA